jgi:hemolysin activation/secretion protein
MPTIIGEERILRRDRPLEDHYRANRYGVAIAAGLLLLMAGGRNAAAQRSPLPGTGVLEGSPIPRILPPSPPGTGGPLAPIPQAVPGGPVPAVNVTVADVAVTGSTAYTRDRLAQFTGGLAGAATPLAKVEAARLAILNLYRTDGYVLTTVTAVLDGAHHLRFNVIEGHVTEVKLDGDIGPAGVQVLRFLNHLTEQTPISTAAIERWLLLAQDIPGISLHAVLRPSAEEPGALTLIAQVQHTISSGLMTIDNRAFRLTGPEQGLAVLDVNSLTQFGERTEVSLYSTPGADQIFGQVATEAFVGGSGLKVRIYGGSGASTPSGFLHTIDYQGTTTVFGISGSYPVIRSREQTLNVSAYLDATESEIREAAGPQGQEVRQSRDSVRAGRLGADYVLQDELLGGDRSALNTASVRLSQGLTFLGGTGNGNSAPGRIGERMDFFAATAQVSRTQTLFQPWPGASVALKASLAGQVSDSILPPTEKFFLGGAEFNRGFYSGEVTGDNAYTWSVELQLNTSFDITPFGTPITVAPQFYVFYDQGYAWQHTNLEPNQRLSSEGTGMRLNLTRYTEFDVEGVIRNTRLPNGTPGVVQPLKADAVYWRVLARF